MLWDDFYDRYSDWSESTLKTRISALEDIGNGEDVVDVCLNLPEDALKAQLVRKAMKLGVAFTHDDILLLDGELPDAVFDEAVRYAGFSVDNPYFDAQDFDWDDFYAACADLPLETLLACIPKIKCMGDRDEVVNAVLCMPSPADEALYRHALSCGVRFTAEQMDLMGQEPDFTSEQESAEHFDTRVKPRKKRFKGRRAGIILGILHGLVGITKRGNDRCDGDCENCPPHYGYRYGRWYYGHGHTRGCERGGNQKKKQ